MRSIVRQVERVAGRREPLLRVVAGQRALADAARVVVFPGSFNPLTRAHSGLVETALATGYDAALWLLAVASVDKERVERAALPDRMAQMRAYVHGSPANAVALANRGLYYEQARLLRGRVKTAEVSILVGYDKAPQIFDARYYDDRDAALAILFANVRLLVAPRAGAGRAELATLLARPENQRFAERVTYLDAPAQYANDSSTRARRQAAAESDLASLHEYPPEAIALIETGAYSARPHGRGSEDRYTQRLAWLAGLADDVDGR
jgi:nicotinic acid mononucleotide adenylyltransferase